MTAADTFLTPTYGQQPFVQPIPSAAIPQQSMTPRAAAQLINDEIDLDAANSSDLGSYITDYMEPEVDEIIKRTLGKVFIDRSEYPQTSIIGDRMAAMIQNWYHGTPSANNFIGTPTIGSSEAVMLGLIAHRRAWENTWNKRRKLTSVAGIANYYRRDKPFMVYARSVHTCWHKYSKYYNSPELVFSLSDNDWTINANKVRDLLNSSIFDLKIGSPDFQRFYAQILDVCDFDEIADAALLKIKRVYELVSLLGCVVGTTFTGQADDVSAVNDVLTQAMQNNYPGTADKVDIPIHVDAASGGFILPFSAPNLKWDFQLTQVRSINVSNHKFGLCYPGIGTAVFKNDTTVDPDLIYNITYLGAAFRDYTVNFSRGSALVLAAYYNLIRLGLDGYQAVVMNCLTNARNFRHIIENDPTASKYLQIISDNDKFPMVVWIDKRKDAGQWKLTDLSAELEKKAWKLPAYPLPYTNSEHPDGPLAMRVVVRQDVSMDKSTILFNDIVAAIKHLESLSAQELEIMRKQNERFKWQGARGC